MLSRVANSIYWMNRYIERVENYARFVSVNINLSYDLPGMISEQWGLLLEATHDRETFDKLYPEETEDKIIYFITFDPQNPNSIYNILGNARENARTVKETLPKEIWEHLNSFYLSFKQFSTNKKLDFEELPKFYENIKQQCQLFAGMIDGTLLRDEAYYFANMGKFLERADKTSRFLDIGYFNFKSVSDIKTVNPQDLLVWSAVLKSVSAFNMYRQQYKSLRQENIIEFLIKDRDFPRAICHSIKKAEYAIYRISGTRPQDSYSNQAEKAITQLKHEIDFTETNEIIKYGLHKYLNDFQVKNNIIDQEIFKVYFA
ncbi:Domain of unknown function DUF403 [Spirosomataceae bacterium]|jgi:uncharacterized alpha-E superfamily protein